MTSITCKGFPSPALKGPTAIYVDDHALEKGKPHILRTLNIFSKLTLIPESLKCPQDPLLELGPSNISSLAEVQLTVGPLGLWTQLRIISPILVKNEGSHSWQFDSLRNLASWVRTIILGKAKRKPLKLLLSQAKDSESKIILHSRNGGEMVSFMCQLGWAVVPGYLVKHYSRYFCQGIFG